MSDDRWLSSPAMRTLLDDLVRATVKRYRIDTERAEEILTDAFAANQPLRELAAKEDAPDRIRRTSAFKNAAAAAKREVYYALRRYRRDETELERLIGRLCDLPASADEGEAARLQNEICNLHASTRERQSYAAEFYEQMFQHLDGAAALIDVGCGMQPLQFPFSKAPETLQCYAAFDSDTFSIRAVQAAAARQPAVQLVAVRHDLRDGWERCCELVGVERFDVALMLKLVPVVQRQARDLLPILAGTPANKWLISGSKQSMTKRRDISRREEAAIRSFVELSKKSVATEFAAGEEFVFVVE